MLRHWGKGKKPSSSASSSSIDDDDDDDYEDDDSERISVYDAADMWYSSGQEEDEMYGYSEEELRRAHDAY